jgi:two-component system chemotaxis response regulator CheB
MILAYGITVIGTSWGGLAALRELIAAFPADMPIPVVLVQHRHRESDNALSRLLQEETPLNVCEVEDKAPILAGNIYIAPPDYHLLVDKDYFTLSVDEPIRFSRPSIDLTFASAADAYGDRTIGAVLTGANADGAEGLRRIAERGGAAFVQEPVTAESPTMPAAALRAVPKATVLPICDIGKAIVRLAKREMDPRQARRKGLLDRPEAAP